MPPISTTRLYISISNCSNKTLHNAPTATRAAVSLADERSNTFRKSR